MVKRRKPKRAEIKKKLLKKVIFTMIHHKTKIYRHQGISMSGTYTKAS